jgi:type II secretion system (T2SS) protein E
VSTPLRERPDAPLGTLIFRAGLLPAETIESALEEGVKTGKRLGEILTERGLLKEVDLARLLAGQKGLDFVPVREHIVDPAAAALFTHDQARLFRALPYAFEDGIPVVAIPDPTDEVLLRNIREALGRDEIRFVVSTRGELAEIVEDVYTRAVAAAPAAAAEPVPSPPAEPEPGFVQNPEPPSPVAEERPEQAVNGNGSYPDGAAVPEVAPLAPPPASEPAAPIEVPVVQVEEAAPAPAAAEPAVVAASAVPIPTAPVEQPAVVEPATAPEPAVAHEPAAAPEPVTSPDPVPAHEPAAPATPLPAPLPLPLSEPAIQPSPYAPAASQPVAANLSPAADGRYEVTIRLTNGERVEAGVFATLDAAKEGAKALMAQVAASGLGEWPFVSGRFLKPDTIVSVDIAERSGPGTA